MKYDVYGIGNALVDKEFEVTENFLAQHGIEKGLMTLIDEDRHHELLAALQSQHQMIKRSGGGSAANTMVALSQFGGSAFYACKVANDEFGEFYGNDLRANGVDNALEKLDVNGVTGKCMVMITPDAERTMNTFLGITADFSSDELHLDELRNAKYLYAEGYLVTSDVSRAAVLAARKIAAENGIKMAYTFSDPSMVTYFRDGVNEVIGDGVDVLFCNQEEALIYSECSDLSQAVEKLLEKTEKLVVTMGADGAMVANRGGERIQVPTQAVKAIDTNGAGDMFAGAFMYGLTHGMSDEQSVQLANAAAAQIVTVHGPRLEKAQSQQILASLS